MSASKGARYGLAAGFLVAVSTGAVIGVVKPVGNAADFMTKAFFGAFAYGLLPAGPACLIGALSGGVIGRLCDRPLPRMTTRRWMAMVALVGVLIGGTGEVNRLRRRQSESSARAQRHRGIVSGWKAGWRSGANTKWVAYHSEMARKYEHAARHPWLAVEPDPPEPPAGE